MNQITWSQIFIKRISNKKEGFRFSIKMHRNNYIIKKQKLKKYFAVSLNAVFNIFKMYGVALVYSVYSVAVMIK